MTKKTHTTDTIKFIPTIKDWEGLYSNWFKRLVNALWKWLFVHDCGWISAA